MSSAALPGWLESDGGHDCVSVQESGAESLHRVPGDLRGVRSALTGSLLGGRRAWGVRRSLPCSVVGRACGAQGWAGCAPRGAPSPAGRAMDASSAWALGGALRGLEL